MLDYHKKQFLRELLNLVLLFNGSEDPIEGRNSRRLLGTSYYLVQSHESNGADRQLLASRDSL